jgi:hypothetical protein
MREEHSSSEAARDGCLCVKRHGHCLRAPPLGPEIPSIAERTGVKIVAGPYVNNEHLTVAIVEADKAEPVDRFLVESRLAQWNKVRVMPSRTVAEGMSELAEQPPVF